jgi:hypothetical protein
MKQPLLSANAGLVFLILVVVCFVTMAAQAPRAAGDGASRTELFPPPKNLQVLPKDMTCKQVHDLMEQWKMGLGMSCAGCHAEDKRIWTGMAVLRSTLQATQSRKKMLPA